jgi:flagellar biosynthesis protein FlhB
MEDLFEFLKSVAKVVLVLFAYLISIGLTQRALMGNGAFDAEQAFWLAIILQAIATWLVSSVGLWGIKRRRMNRRLQQYRR